MGRLKGRGLPPMVGRAPSRLRGLDPGPRRSDRPLYTAAWRRARAAFLARMAQAAAERGDVLRCCQTGVALTGRHPAPDSPVVDHIEPDRGDPELFWDEGNWQVVSKEWHDRVKQAREKRGEG